MPFSDLLVVSKFLHDYHQYRSIVSSRVGVTTSDQVSPSQ